MSKNRKRSRGRRERIRNSEVGSRNKNSDSGLVTFNLKPGHWLIVRHSDGDSYEQVVFNPKRIGSYTLRLPKLIFGQYEQRKREAKIKA